jgi:hypothetical protein
MAKFTPNEMNLSQINGGNQFVNGDIVEADTLNKVIEGVAFAQENGGSGGGSNVEVVQGTGTSTTAVMSQKATTEAINSAKPQFSVDPIDGSLVISGGSNFVYAPPSGGGGVGNKTLYRHDCYFTGNPSMNTAISIHMYITAYTPNPTITADYLNGYANEHNVTATGHYDSVDGEKGIILGYATYPDYGEGALIVYQIEGDFTGQTSIGTMTLNEFTMQVTTTQII